MGKFIGGDILELVCQHTLGTFRFEAKSGESFTVDPGGVRVNDDAQQITGAGSMILQKNRVRWMVEGPIAVNPKTNKELNDLIALQEHEDLGVWTMTHISGGISKGTGTPVGDLSVDTNTAQMTLKLSGQHKLEQI